MLQHLNTLSIQALFGILVCVLALFFGTRNPPNKPRQY
jgi:hypothetical protein